MFGVRDADSPANTRGEKFWFVVYGIAAFMYRLFILFVIILYIGGKFFFVGVVLAVWAVATQVVVPVSKTTTFLLSSPRLKRNRGRALATTSLLIGALIVLFFVVPAPLSTRVEGVIWPSDKSQVRAEVDGFVSRVLVAGGSEVEKGRDLIHTEDPFLNARVKVLEAQLRGLSMQLGAAQTSDRVQTAVIREEIATVRADLARARARATALLIRSPRQGIFVIPNEVDLPGRFVRQGQLLAYVVDPAENLTARSIVSQDDIALVRQRTRRVEVMPADWGASIFVAEVLREVPGGTRHLPTPALGAAGGGQVAVDPRDPKGETTMERVFEFEIGLPPAARTGYLGQRVFVKFDHGYEPLGFQIYRSLRQLFLRLFSV